jgi:hypothetical protein
LGIGPRGIINDEEETKMDESLDNPKTDPDGAARLSALFDLVFKRPETPDPKCWKCGNMLGQPVVLAGHYRAIICPGCRKVWDRAMMMENEAAWLNARTQETRAKIGIDNHLPDAADRLAAFFAAQVDLFKIAAAWAPKPGVVEAGGQAAGG